MADERTGSSGGAAGAGGEAAARPAPASFTVLCAGIAAQVQVGLGLLAHPVTGKTGVDLPTAKHGIDLLEMLEAKSKGNLDAGESSFLAGALHHLRMAFVEATRSRG